MKKILLLVALFLLPLSASATTTVSGTLNNLGTGAVGTSAFVRFWLRGCGGNQPTVSGTAVIAPSQGGVFYFDFVANASGVVSGTLYSTRDSTGLLGGDITCGTSKLSVWYGLQIFVAGKGGPEVPVHAKNGVTLNISTVSPLSTTPVVPAPTGDNTYARLDATNQPFLGTVTAPALEGCQHVNALQSFAVALAAVSSPGCIAVDPGTYTVAVNAAIPATVSLISESGGLLSIANAVTLTVNGPVVAPAVQIFAYVGTGVATIGANTPTIYPTWFPGADICAQTNAAYTAMTVPGIRIQIPGQAAPYNCTTSMPFSRIGVPPTLDLNGQSINFTPTGGSSGAITAISEATNTVTATSALNPGANNFVCITGYVAPADQYNGCYKVATSSGANFTYVSGIRGIAGAGAGTAQNATVFITADWGPVAGANYPWGGIFNGELKNNNCVTTGGCGNGTIGLLVGSANGGMGQGGSIDRVRFEGWGDAEVLNSGVSFSLNHLNVWYWRSIMGVYSASAEEGINWQGGGAEFNAHGVMLTTPSTAGFDRFHFDSNITMGLSSTGGGQITANADWFENLSGAGCNGYTQHYYNGDTNIQFIGGGMQDDCNANPAADYWVTANGQLQVYGMSVSSAGRQAGPGTLFVANVTGEIHVINNTPGTLGQQPTSVCPVGTIVVCSETRLGGGSTPIGLFTPRVRLTTSGFAIYDVLPATGGGAGSATFPNATGTIDLLSATSTTTTQVLHATATPGVGTYSAIAGGDLPATVVQTNQANTYSAFLQDFTSASMKIPQSAGCTAGVNALICLDSTAKINHLLTNNADSLVAATTATDTVTTHVLHATATAGIYSSAAIATGDLPTAGIPNVVYNNAVNTGTAAMTLNMAASTTANSLVAPAQAGLTSGTDGAIAYDTTAKLTHLRTNGADSIAAATTATSTTTTQVLHATAVAGVYASSAVVTADIATALTTPGPIGGTTPSTGKFTTITETNLLISNTAPTIAGAGCGGSGATIASNNGTAAFTINVGTAPTLGGCTITMPAATTAWTCFVNDITTTSTGVFYQKQTGAASTTSVVLQNFSDVAAATAPTANDIYRVNCSAY